MNTLYTMWLIGTFHYGLDYIRFTNKPIGARIKTESPAPRTSFLLGLLFAMMFWPGLIVLQLLKALDFIPASFEKAMAKEFEKQETPLQSPDDFCKIMDQKKINPFI